MPYYSDEQWREVVARRDTDSLREYIEYSEGDLQRLINVLSEDISSCKELLATSMDWVNASAWYGKTPLYAASKGGHVDVCKLLITEGNADVNKATEYGLTSLYAASEGGHVDVCKILITEGNADVNKATVNGKTPFCTASEGGHVDVCKLLFTEGNADVNKADRNGKAPLHAASAGGHVDVCKLLITEGNADVNKADRIGETPLYAASEGGHVDVCKILITEGNADVNKATLDGETPLYAASKGGHVDLCKLLITEGNADVNKATKDGETPLYAASQRHHVDVCKLLIIEGNADVNKATQYYVTPLHLAAVYNRLDVCRLLLETPDIDPSQVDKFKRTPLHVAARRGNLDVCQLLLETPTVDPSPLDSEGKEPLDVWATDVTIIGTDNRQLFKKYTQNAQLSVLMKSGGTPVRTIKLFLVGDPAKGKSTLKRSLSSGLFQMFSPIHRKAEHIPTPGIKVEEKTVRGAGSFMIWDTAGQVEFHITHAMLLGTSKGIFLAVYSCCDSEEEQTKQLKYWVCFIKTCHDRSETKKPIVQVVGTHVDMVKDTRTAVAIFQKHVEHMKMVFGDHIEISEEVILLDSRQTRSRGLGQLKDSLNRLAEPLRGERTPKICDEIIKRISVWCDKNLPLLHFKDFTEKVRSEIDQRVTDDTLRIAVSYLHNMGEIHHAKLRDRDPVIIVHPNWLTTTIFAPIFATPNFRADYSGLPLKQEYSVGDLKYYFKLENLDLLLDLLGFFELAYRNDDGTFIIPAKLPDDTPSVAWSGESKRYFGRRITCRNACDMFSIDMFPCLQVSMMNRYRQKNVKPLFSRFGVKVFGKVEGMVQLTRDKRSVHIAVRVKVDNEIKKGQYQLQEMKSLVINQIDERSKGTDVTTSYLSPGDLKMSTDLEDGVSFYTENAMQEALKNGEKELAHPRTLTPEATFDIDPHDPEMDEGIGFIEKEIRKLQAGEQSLISEREILDVEGVISLPKVEELCGYLGLSEVDIQDAKLSAEREDIKGKKRKMLQLWRTQTGHQATKQKLLEALLRTSKRSAFEALKIKWEL